MRLYRLDIACNDDRGNFAGRAYQASAAGCDLELDVMAGVAFTLDGNRFRIHRKWFEFEQHRFWVGNWCWDGFGLRPAEYRRAVRWLAWNGWQCTSGSVRWSDAYDRLPRKAK